MYGWCTRKPCVWLPIDSWTKLFFSTVPCSQQMGRTKKGTVAVNPLVQHHDEHVQWKYGSSTQQIPSSRRGCLKHGSWQRGAFFTWMTWSSCCFDALLTPDSWTQGWPKTRVYRLSVDEIWMVMISCLLLYQWPFQEPIYWRYLPHIRPIFQG